MGPLDGRHVLEFEHDPAIGFAGSLLQMLGATVSAVEPEGGSPLRHTPPYHGGRSTTFAYLTAGKTRCAAGTLNRDAIAAANIVLHADPLPAALGEALAAAPLPAGGRAVVRVTPYGATGPKSGWQGSELTLFQAGGEGYLMPHGLPYEEHPERPPVGVGRYSAHYQSGIAAALAAVAALRLSRASGRAEHVDVSMQDAQLSLNYFTVSRYVEGARESRQTRAFRFAGILRCSDGYVELVPLENHHWLGVLELLGHPAELMTPEFADPIARAAKGDAINAHLRRWAAGLTTAQVVGQAAQAGIPCGPYLSPADLPADAQLAHRKFFVSAGDDPEPGDLFPGPAWAFDRWEKPRLGRAGATAEVADATA